MLIFKLKLCIVLRMLVWPSLSLHNEDFSDRHHQLPQEVLCPSVMCAEPCPQGQYLVVNEQGCETCDCFNPCQSFECEVGECHWKLDRNCNRPAPFCAECVGGQQWDDCGTSEQCIATCVNTMPNCPRNCYAGCRCPAERPIWHHNQCITIEDCKHSCDGDQEWTDCGAEETWTCSDTEPAPAVLDDACIPRCQCPEDRPVWDNDRQICITADECVL